MTMMQGIGEGAREAAQAVTRRVQAARQDVPAAAGEVAGQAVSGDGFQSSGPIVRNSGNVVPILLKFPPQGSTDARELVERALNVQRGNHGNFCGTPVVMEMMAFHQGYASASTDSLKRAIQFLDREEEAVRENLKQLDARENLSGDEREMLKSWSESDLNLIKGMRATLAKELAARDKGTDKARRLIDSVLDASGAEQLEAFAGFVNKVKQASDGMLERLRDQLTDRLAGSADREQRLICKLMLHTVNREIDRRALLPLAVPAHSQPLSLTADELRELNARSEGVGPGVRGIIKSLANIKD